MGRPLKYETPEKIQEIADKYFEETPIEQWTITGLAIALDTNRQTLMNYEAKDEFFDTIKRLKTKVEHSYELALRKKGGSGEIFGLKNFGWRDKTEVDNNTNMTVNWVENWPDGSNEETG
jgi:hypothetical protein